MLKTPRPATSENGDGRRRLPSDAALSPISAGALPVMLGVALLFAVLTPLASVVIKLWLPRLLGPIPGSRSGTLGPFLVPVAIIIAAWLVLRLWCRRRSMEDPR